MFGMVWYGMVWYGVVWHDMVWYGVAWYGMVSDDIAWLSHGIVWYRMVSYGMVWSVRTYLCAYIHLRLLTDLAANCEVSTFLKEMNERKDPKRTSAYEKTLLTFMNTIDTGTISVDIQTIDLGIISHFIEFIPMIIPTSNHSICRTTTNLDLTVPVS